MKNKIIQIWWGLVLGSAIFSGGIVWESLEYAPKTAMAIQSEIAGDLFK